VYYHESQISLRDPVGSGADEINKIILPFIGVLDFKVENEEVNWMSGYWYDIENSMYRLAQKIPNLKGYEDFKSSIESGARAFKGTLEFKRLPRLPGMRN
jgi:hypothetical protein